MRAVMTWSLMGVIPVLVILSLPVPERAALPQAMVAPSLPPPKVETPFEDALHQARLWRLRAKTTAKQAMEIRASTVSGTEATDDEAWRRTLLNADPTGAIDRALIAARQATELARTPEETGHATTLRVMIECDAGHHREELRQARALATLDPGSPHALTVLLRAARCNEQEVLARRTADALEALSRAGRVASTRP